MTRLFAGACAALSALLYPTGALFLKSWGQIAPGLTLAGAGVSLAAAVALQGGALRRLRLPAVVLVMACSQIGLALLGARFFFRGGFPVLELSLISAALAAVVFALSAGSAVPQRQAGRSQSRAG